MAKRNYDQMYKSKSYDEKEIPVVKEEPAVEETAEAVGVKPEPVKEKKAEKKIGTVIGGLRLNVRTQPNGDVVDSLQDGSKVTIVKEIDDWYEIESPKGFVMKKFISI